MITYTIKITEVKAGDPPVVCLEHHCEPENHTPGEECMAIEFYSGLKQVMGTIAKSMAENGSMQQVEGAGETTKALIENMKQAAASDKPQSPDNMRMLGEHWRN